MTIERSDDGEPVRYVVTLIHPVADFEQWSGGVRALDRVLSSYLLSREVYQSLDDPNEVLVHCEVSSAEAAMALLAADIRGELEQAGLDFYPPAFAGREVLELRIGPAPAAGE